MGSVQNDATVVTTKSGQTRRFRSKQERRQIVEECMKPGASIALVARAHDVNANQVFKWRKQYQMGRLELASATTLLPVNKHKPPSHNHLRHAMKAVNRKESNQVDATTRPQSRTLAGLLA